MIVLPVITWYRRKYNNKNDQRKGQRVYLRIDRKTRWLNSTRRIIVRLYRWIIKGFIMFIKMLLAKYIDIDYSQIAHHEQLAETVITDASRIIFPDVLVMIESSIQDLLCEASLLSRSLRKSSSKGKTPINIKRPKITSSNNQATSSTSNNDLLGPSSINSQPGPSTSTTSKKWKIPMEATKNKVNRRSRQRYKNVFINILITFIFVLILFVSHLPNPLIK